MSGEWSKRRHCILYTDPSNISKPSPRNELPYFRPAAVLGIIRREVRTVQDRTIIVYRGCVQGSSLITCTESGIKQALDADCDINNMANRDPNSSTVRNVWIPLAVVRDALPLFIKAQDEILDDKVSIRIVYGVRTITLLSVLASLT